MGVITCIGGIDTDIGKTIATGLMAKVLRQNGYSVITQKIVQTGCHGLSDDIKKHRELMGIGLQIEDIEEVTCSESFVKSCSPHLAAELEGKEVDRERITGNSRKLAACYDQVLLEGVGGLLVPLSRQVTFLDYVKQQNYPLILVSSSRLGSINHTLSALEICANRGVAVKGIIYNCFEETDPEIVLDSKNVFQSGLEQYGYPGRVVSLYKTEKYLQEEKDFPCLLLF